MNNIFLDLHSSHAAMCFAATVGFRTAVTATDVALHKFCRGLRFCIQQNKANILVRMTFVCEWQKDEHIGVNRSQQTIVDCLSSALHMFRLFISCMSFQAEMMAHRPFSLSLSLFLIFFYVISTLKRIRSVSLRSLHIAHSAVINQSIGCSCLLRLFAFHSFTIGTQSEKKTCRSISNSMLCIK